MSRSPFLYRNRNAIERMFRRLKDYRRIPTRHDRLAKNFLAAVCLAATVSYWLRVQTPGRQILLRRQIGLDLGLAAAVRKLDELLVNTAIDNITITNWRPSSAAACRPMPNRGIGSILTSERLIYAHDDVREFPRGLALEPLLAALHFTTTSSSKTPLWLTWSAHL